MGRDGITPGDINNAVAAARLNPPIQIFHSTSDSPTWTGTQNIFNPIGPAGPRWISYFNNLKLLLMVFLHNIEVLHPVSVK